MTINDGDAGADVMYAGYLPGTANYLSESLREKQFLSFCKCDVYKNKPFYISMKVGEIKN